MLDVVAVYAVVASVVAAAVVVVASNTDGEHSSDLFPTAVGDALHRLRKLTVALVPVGKKKHVRGCESLFF